MAAADGKADVRDREEAMRFRPFGVRGLEAVRSGWTPVALAYNLERLAVLEK